MLSEKVESDKKSIVIDQNEKVKSLRKKGNMVIYDLGVGEPNFAISGNINETYQAKKDYVVDYLRKYNIAFIESDRDFYVFIDVSHLRSRIKAQESLSVMICNQLLEVYGVAAMPGSAFGMDDHIRISYACEMNELQQGLYHLLRALALA